MGEEGFRQLRVWQAAKEMAVIIYRSTESGPLARDFGLRDQLRRAAVSVPSNIAKGSLAELRTQLEIARDIGSLPPTLYAELEAKCAEIGRMLGALIKARADHP